MTFDERLRVGRRFQAREKEMRLRLLALTVAIRGLVLAPQRSGG